MTTVAVIAVLITAVIALQNIGSDCIRIIAAVAIAAIVFTTTAAVVMSSGSGCNGGRRQRHGWRY